MTVLTVQPDWGGRRPDKDDSRRPPYCYMPPTGRALYTYVDERTPGQFLCDGVGAWFACRASATWVHGLRLQSRDMPGVWGSFGHHTYGDPWREQPHSRDCLTWGD